MPIETFEPITATAEGVSVPTQLLQDLMGQMSKVMDFNLRIHYIQSFDIKKDHVLVRVAIWFTFQHLVFDLPLKVFGFKKLSDGSIYCRRLHKRIADYINTYLQWGVHRRVTKRSVKEADFTWDGITTDDNTVHHIKRHLVVTDDLLMKKHLAFHVAPCYTFLQPGPKEDETPHYIKDANDIVHPHGRTPEVPGGVAAAL